MFNGLFYLHIFIYYITNNIFVKKLFEGQGFRIFKNLIIKLRKVTLENLFLINK